MLADATGEPRGRKLDVFATKSWSVIIVNVSEAYAERASDTKGKPYEPGPQSGSSSGKNSDNPCCSELETRTPVSVLMSYVPKLVLSSTLVLGKPVAVDVLVFDLVCVCVRVCVWPDESASIPNKDSHRAAIQIETGLHALIVGVTHPAQPSNAHANEGTLLASEISIDGAFGDARLKKNT